MTWVMRNEWRVGPWTVCLRVIDEDHDRKRHRQVVNARWWLDLWRGTPFEDERSARFKLHGQTVVGARDSFGAEVTVGERGADDDLSWSLRVPFFAQYFTADAKWLRRVADALLAIPDPQVKDHYTGGRVTGLRWFEGTLWWDLWHTEHAWSSGTPRYRHGSFNPADWLLGPTKYCEGEEVAREDVEVPMPEGAYYGVCVLRDERWERPRTPWWPALRVRRAHIEMAKGHGVPFPGKGENSWDCGEDATGGITCPADTVEDGVGQLVASVLRSRRRHGGKRWRPDNGPHGAKAEQGDALRAWATQEDALPQGVVE